MKTHLQLRSEKVEKWVFCEYLVNSGHFRLGDLICMRSLRQRGSNLGQYWVPLICDFVAGGPLPLATWSKAA